MGERMLAVYVTCANEKEASKIASAAVGKKLAACANYWKGKSVFKWKGKTRRASEWLLLLKTTEKNYSPLEALVKSLHSYALPAIIALKPVGASKEFSCWVEKEVGASE